MPEFIDYHWTKLTEEEQIANSRRDFDLMNKRRTIREFSREPVSEEVLLNAIRTASTAPSGAHKQPWFFCLVSSPEIKHEIRKAAEEEEKLNYNGRMSKEWLDDLEKFGTDWHKPFLEDAPHLIVVFKQVVEMDGNRKKNNYYVNESVGIATGFLLMALHQAGLHTLTHTPSPMNFLSKILNRPANERPFLLIPVGYPAENCKVPALKRKGMDALCKIY